MREIVKTIPMVYYNQATVRRKLRGDYTSGEGSVLIIRGQLSGELEDNDVITQMVLEQCADLVR